MPSDGPPWTVGSNCNISLQHASVFSNVAQGLFVKPDSFRVILPKIWYPGTNAVGVTGAGPLAAGRRAIEFVALANDEVVHSDGTPSLLTAGQWHNTAITFGLLVNTAVTLIGPDGTTYVVSIEEYEDRLVPLGGQFLLRWETRLLFVED